MKCKTTLKSTPEIIVRTVTAVIFIIITFLISVIFLVINGTQGTPSF